MGKPDHMRGPIDPPGDPTPNTFKGQRYPAHREHLDPLAVARGFFFGFMAGVGFLTALAGLLWLLG